MINFMYTVYSKLPVHELYMYNNSMMHGAKVNKAQKTITNLNNY